MPDNKTKLVLCDLEGNVLDPDWKLDSVLDPISPYITWREFAVYEHGAIIEYEGNLYKVNCPEHGDDCPGGGLRTGFLPPDITIEDTGHRYYEPYEEHAEPTDAEGLPDPGTDEVDPGYQGHDTSSSGPRTPEWYSKWW